MVNNLLDYWMGELYKSTVIRGGKDDSVMKSFRKNLDSNQELKASAKERLDSFSDDVLKRDFLSRKQKEFLETAIGASNA